MADRPLALLSRSWRILLVLVAAGLLTVHATYVIAPTFGLGTAINHEALFAAHIDHRYIYNVDNAKGETIGEMTLELDAADTFFRIRSSLVLDDIAGLGPVAAPLLPLIEQGAPKTMNVINMVELDDRFRLSTLELSGGLLGFGGEMEGRATHKGLEGTYEISGIHGLLPPGLGLPGIRMGRKNPLFIEGFPREETLGLTIAPALPPGVKPGDTLRQKFLSPSATPPFLGKETAILQAQKYETIATAKGDKRLLRIEMRLQGTPMAHLWVDEQGVVFQSIGIDFPLHMSMKKIEKDGLGIWPEIEEAPGGGIK